MDGAPGLFGGVKSIETDPSGMTTKKQRQKPSKSNGKGKNQAKATAKSKCVGSSVRSE
jgi:hypothetical protein